MESHEVNKGVIEGVEWLTYRDPAQPECIYYFALPEAPAQPTTEANYLKLLKAVLRPETGADLNLAICLRKAVSILRTIPRVAKMLGTDWRNRTSMLDDLEAKLPLDCQDVVRKEKEQLDELVTTYRQHEQDRDWNRAARHRQKVRIAAQVCILIGMLEPVRDQIDQFDSLKSLLGEAVPKALGQ